MIADPIDRLAIQDRPIFHADAVKALVLPCGKMSGIDVVSSLQFQLSHLCCVSVKWAPGTRCGMSIKGFVRMRLEARSRFQSEMGDGGSE